MKTSLYLLILSFFLPFFLACQNKSSDFSIEAFEKKHLDFRFSLYSYLNKLEEEELRQFKFGKSPELLLKIKEYLQKNQKEIRMYRKAKLQKISSTAYDLSNFVKDTTIQYFGFYEMEFDSTVIQFLKVDPVWYGYSMINSVFSRLMGTSEMAGFVFRSILAFPKILSIEKSPRKWDMYYDLYSFLMVFSYYEATGNFGEVVVYKRKSKP